MSNTATIEADVQAVKASAQRPEAVNAARTETIGTASVGDVVRQGDLYLINLGSVNPFAKGDMEKDPNKQLAPGTSQGSRHVLQGGTHYKVDKAAIATAIKKAIGMDVPVQLIGGVVHSAKGRCTIAHPEHSHRVLTEGDYWAVTFQRQYAEDVRRVQD